MTAGDVERVADAGDSAVDVADAGDSAVDVADAGDSAVDVADAGDSAVDVAEGVAAFTVRGLTKAYRTRAGAVEANRGIDLTVRAGELFGVLGPNGAGKTTLIRQLVGLSKPDAGSIALFGRDVGGRRLLVADVVAYLPQDDAALADLTPSAALAITGRLRGLSRAQATEAAAAIVDELGLGAFAGRPIGKLSGGQRRLAGVGAALVADRPVLVLDEPTTGLDPVARRAVWAALDRRRLDRGATVVLVTHNVLEAETVLDRVAILDRGRVVATDTPGRLKELVDRDVRLDLAWRHDPPADSLVDALRSRAEQHGRRWRVRLPAEEARAALARLTSGVLFEALDDFTLTTPSLEDVYVALGGSAHDMERS
jgi:ABC-2 type transport system ATP-binding protein